jgi:hypothetical protein
MEYRMRAPEGQLSEANASGEIIKVEDDPDFESSAPRSLHPPHLLGVGTDAKD